MDHINALTSPPRGEISQKSWVPYPTSSDTLFHCSRLGSDPTDNLFLRRICEKVSKNTNIMQLEMSKFIFNIVKSFDYSQPLHFRVSNMSQGRHH